MFLVVLNPTTVEAPTVAEIAAAAATPATAAATVAVQPVTDTVRRS